MRSPRKMDPGAPMPRACLLAWVMCAAAATTAWAEVRVDVEHVNPGTAGWKFEGIMRPSASDLARQAKVSVVENELDADGAPVSALTNGVLPRSGDDLKESVFLTNANADGGKILMDLGAVQPVAEVHTYSWHEYEPDQGARAPQVYTLYGSAAADPKTGDPARNPAWVKIAAVDTRPNKTGKRWGGQYGVIIRDTKGSLGNYRYLLFDVRPTLSPLQSNPVWTNTFFSEIDVHTKKTLENGGDAAAPAIPRSKVSQVIVVFKTHFDIGYTDLARNIVAKYRTEMIDKALEVCDRSESLPPEQRFVWTLPGWPMTQILWEGQTPERRARVEKAVREGRLVWHALPYTLETEGSDLEDVVRGLRFSSDLSRKFAMPLPRDAKMTDVPSHSWALPTILKHAGVDFLHLGCNPASSSPDVPDLFWWQGPDGSRLLTMYTAKDYGTGLIPPRDWPFSTWLALIHTGDNQGPPGPEEVEALLAQARRDLPGVEVRMGRLSDFGDAILKENPDLPVVRGDMPDTWIHGFLSMPLEAKLARNVRPRIAALESLNTLLRGWGVAAPDEKKTLAAAYEKSLMYGEHTWGLSGGNVGFRYGEEWRKARQSEELGPRYRKSEESWREHGAYIEAARDLAQPEFERNLAALARSVKVKGERIVVFNPLPWARDGVVEVDTGGAGISALKDKESGEVLPVEARDGKVRFVAREVPAMGYKTFVPAEPRRKTNADGPKVDENAGTIENRFYTVTLDQSRGGIASIVDKRTGRELVDAAGKHACGQYLYERFDAGNVKSYLDAYVKTTASWAEDDLGKRNLPGTDQFRYTAASPAGFTVKWEASGACASAVMSAGAGGGVPHAVTTRITLYRDEPYVDIEWGVKDKEPDPWPEGGWICLPFKVQKPVFELGRLASIVNPTRDVIRSSNHDIYCLSSGMTIANPDGVGVGLCALDSPLVSLDRPGLWKYSRDFMPKKPEVFVNLFNNQWSTNFQMWMGGSWTSRVRVWAVDKTGGEAGLQTPSWEARVPCVAAFFDGPKGDLPLSQAGLELSRKGVLVTAFGPNPDGEGTILRLWEQVGDAAPCKVQLPKGMKVPSVQPCDLRGQAMGRTIPVKRGSFEVPMTPFAPVTVIIRMKDEG